MALRKGSIEIKNRILSVCVRLFLEQGYHNTPISQIIKEADISASTFQNIFHTKDGVLTELIEFMFSGQFGAARSIAGETPSPVYTYAAETAIQLVLTELNENFAMCILRRTRCPQRRSIYTSIPRWSCIKYSGSIFRDIPKVIFTSWK